VDIFNEGALRYDSWYSRHPSLARSEAETIRQLGLSGIGVDIGAGSGFFTRITGAIALDPSLPMLVLAKRRVEDVIGGVGELIPLRDSSMNFVLIVVTLCFAKDPEAMLREAMRILKLDGTLAVCIVPLESPWGRVYSELKDNPFYSRARFLTLNQLEGIVMKLGFRITNRIATLGSGVGDYYEEPREVSRAQASDYGFVCIKAVRPQHSIGQ